MERQKAEKNSEKEKKNNYMLSFLQPTIVPKLKFRARLQPRRTDHKKKKNQKKTKRNPKKEKREELIKEKKKKEI